MMGMMDGGMGGMMQGGGALINGLWGAAMTLSMVLSAMLWLAVLVLVLLAIVWLVRELRFRPGPSAGSPTASTRS